MLALALALALAPPALRDLEVRGDVVDVLPGGHLSVTRGGARALVTLDGRRTPAPRDAVFVDVCGGRPVFATPAGLQRGEEILAGDALFRVADPVRLHRAPLCTAAGELLLPAPDGVRVFASGSARLLPFRPAPRGYGGDGGLRGKPFSVALSLYAPSVHEADLDGDGDLDLLLTADRRAVAFRRGPGGLEVTPRAIALKTRLGADVRFTVGDLDGDGQAELVVTELSGLIPKRTRGTAISDVLGARRRAELWDRDGFTAPLGFDGGSLVVFHIDTSVVALGAVLVTGRLPLFVERLSRDGRLERLLDLEIAADLDGGITGPLPLLHDVDGDGDRDLVHAGANTVRLFRSAGDELAAAGRWDLQGAERIAPADPGVLVVESRRRGRTRVLLLRP